MLSNKKHEGLSHEAHTKHKASYKLTRATTIHCKDATDVVISIPETNQTVKLKALDVKPKDYPPPGMSWLNRQAMPSLLRPARTPAQASSAKRSGSAAHRPARRLTPLPAPLSGQPRSPLSSI